MIPPAMPQSPPPPIKIIYPGTHFRPFCGAFPTLGLDAEECLINMLYVEDELVRWDKSICWVSDDAPSLDEVGTLRSLLDVARHLVSDSNGPLMHRVLSALPSRLSPWSCSIIPNLVTKHKLWDDLSLTLVDACGALIPLCKPGKHDEDLLVLKSLDVVARDCLVADKERRIFKGELGWTSEDVVREQQEVDQMIRARSHST